MDFLEYEFGCTHYTSIGINYVETVIKLTKFNKDPKQRSCKTLGSGKVFYTLEILDELCGQIGVYSSKTGEKL